ncbi:PREDICTED: UV-B-induced protein At3g17800, chloroplastic isoform X2 [Tarenaya hassleriana]|uniref:UV-B-induced protein At3g17800, chloroplastic isoform X2 n=1 Tax=Tarenaya hassleriana TaxID=28532 RepID=UPI0008FD046E|nr:PREDICTED: UV-B-induced protein At3g17800, chloroplastic isoform X2 [Tarenaya hassleriana]
MIARRIAQLKEHYSQIAVQDIMYMLIFYKFSEIRVPLVPKLSRCIYNGRLEIWPSKDWELESVHGFDSLELIKEHVSAVIGLRVNSSVTDSWATTQIQKLHLQRAYSASILYGYFLKSASLRHQLESSLSNLHINQQRPPVQYSKGPVFSCSFPASAVQTFNQLELKQLRQYISRFDPETFQRCAKPRSEEGRNLIENQSLALLGQEKGDDETIVTSFSSLKRLVLEAVAFGTFLWDAEEYVDGVFKLRENDNAEEEESSSI